MALLNCCCFFLLLSLCFILALIIATCLGLSLSRLLFSPVLNCFYCYNLSSRFRVRFFQCCLHLAALLRGHNRWKLMLHRLVLVFVLVLIHLLLLVLADALVMLAWLTFAHIIDKRTLLMLLAERAILAHLLLCLQLFTFLCNYMRK